MTAFIHSNTCKATILILLSISTILFFNYYEKYSIVGPELLQNINFDNQAAGWNYSRSGISISTSKKSVKLHSNVYNVSKHFNQTVNNITGYQRLRLTFDTKAQKVTPGNAVWMTARVHLVSYSQTDTALHSPTHVLTSLIGNSEWSHNEVVFVTPLKMPSLRVTVQLAKATGTLWARNLSLQPVVKTNEYKTYRSAIALLWAGTVFWVVLPLLLSIQRKKKRLIVALLTLIIVFATLMPSTVKNNINNSLLDSDNTALLKIQFDTDVFKLKPYLLAPDIFKIGHFFMFSFLTVFALLYKSHTVSHTELIGYLLIFAATTEVLQLYLNGRNAQLGDIFIDSAGIMTGAIVFYIARFREKLT